MNLIMFFSALIISTTLRYSFGLKVQCRPHTLHENSCAGIRFEVPSDEPRIDFDLNYADADDITYVFLSTIERGFTVFPVEIFEFFRNLETVFIRSTIEKLSKDDWKNAKKLKSLEVSFNALTIISRDGFTDLDKLNILDLGHNKIYTIEPGAFDFTKNLELLILSHNEITNIQNGTFVGLEKLRVIELHFNRIRSIEEGAFDVPGLKVLKLENNKLTTLPSSMFSKMPNLEKILVKDNKLTRIDPSIFSLQNLTFIGLSKNHIGNIDLTEFANLRRLKKLNLRSSGFSFNSTKAVGRDKSLTEDNMSVRHIDIANNGLTNLKDLFDQLSVFKGLKVLNMMGNRFTSYDSVNSDDIKETLPRLIEIIIDGVSAKCESINIFKDQMKDLNVTVKLTDKSCL